MEAILYSTRCPKCKVLEAKLKQKKIEYIENTSMEDMQKLGLCSAPALSIDGKLLLFADAVKYINEREI